MKEIRVSRSRTGLACAGVGGGACTNTFAGTFVLRGKDLKDLPGAIFIRQKGSLACSDEQAIVPLQKGDVIVKISGHLPVAEENPDINYDIGVFEGETHFPSLIEYGEFAILEEKNDLQVEVPESVREGLSVYHNRDGKFFVR